MFLLRSLLGLGQRHRSKWPPFLIGFGIFACIAAALLGLVVVPTNLVSGWRAAGYPHTTPSELRALPAGSKVLVDVTIPSTMEASAATQGLALFYIERSESATGGSNAKREREPVTERQRERDVPPSLNLTLSDDSVLPVRVPAQTLLSNAQTIRLPNDTESVTGLRIERSYIGYLPGQHLIVQGTWESNGLTASEFFAGSLDEYLYDLRVTRPLQLLLTSLCCAGLGVALVAIGLVTRLLRR